MERELFICNCENTEHQIVFSYFEDDDVANVYATIHLRKKSFWERLKYGIKYIFGYQCCYGAFDEFIFNPKDAKKLQKVVNFLKEESDNTLHCGLDGTIWGETVRRNANTETNPVNMLNGNIAEQTANTYSEG